MKIARVRAIPCLDWRPMLFVIVETDTGIVGVGEAGITSREIAVAAVVDALADKLVGQDPMRIEHLWQVMWRSGFFPAGEMLSTAVAAIDIALHDIKAKALGVPVYELLGGRARDRVLTYCHIHGGTTDELLAAARKAVEAGNRVLRWGIADTLTDEFDPTSAVARNIDEWRLLREEFGDAVELCVDLHTKLGVPDSVRLCRAIERYRPMFVEDPIRAEHPEAYRRLRQQVAVPIAAGEQLATKWDFRMLIEDELIDYARIDLCIAGGLTEGRKIAAMCEAHLIDVVLHNPIGPVSTAAGLHFNIATSNMLVHELARLPGDTLPDAIRGQPEWSDGYLYPPQAPGLGLDVDEEALVARGYERRDMPQLHRPDGSFTNW